MRNQYHETCPLFHIWVTLVVCKGVFAHSYYRGCWHQTCSPFFVLAAFGIDLQAVVSSFFVPAAFGLDLQGVGSTFFVPAAFVLDLQGVVSSKCP